MAERRLISYALWRAGTAEGDRLTLGVYVSSVHELTVIPLQPQLIQGGKVLSTGEDYTVNGAFSAGIAYVTLSPISLVSRIECFAVTFRPVCLLVIIVLFNLTHLPNRRMLVQRGELLHP